VNGYKCFYKGKECEVYAETSFEAQKKAAEEMKAKKRYEVHVVLCEKDVSPSSSHSLENLRNFGGTQ